MCTLSAVYEFLHNIDDVSNLRVCILLEITNIAANDECSKDVLSGQVIWKTTISWCHHQTCICFPVNILWRGCNVISIPYKV